MNEPHEELRTLAPGLLLRSATRDDAAAVLDLWRNAGVERGATDTREGIAHLLAADGDALLVVESHGAVVGSLIAAWDGWRGSFYRLAVARGRRRERIATALLREGERRLRARGARRMTAIAVADDTAAIAFWEAAGYRRQRDRARFVRLADAVPGE